jgi:hypothetical protein
MKAGFPSDLNITAVNPDMTNADFSAVLYGQFAYLWQFTPLALKLGPNSSMTISSEIVPLAIINPWDVVGNSSYLELALELEGLPICSSGSLPSGRINITEPNVHFVLQFPQEVLVGNAFYINISAVNEENETVSASFAIETGSANGLSLEDSSFKQETAQIPPNSNITFSYKFRATEESKSDHGSTISFQVSRGGSGAVDLYSANIRIVNLLTSMWPAIQYGLLFMFLAIIIGLAVYYRRRRKHQKELSRATDSTGLKTLWLGLRFT